MKVADISPGQPSPRYLTPVTFAPCGTPSLSSNARVPLVEGAPAQKIEIVSAVFCAMSSIGACRGACRLNVAGLADEDERCIGFRHFTELVAGTCRRVARSGRRDQFRRCCG